MNQGEKKKLAASGKGSWSNQVVFWDETEERNSKPKITVVDLKLLEAALAKTARCHECVSKITSA